MSHTRRVGADIVIAFILVALVFGGLLWQKYHEAAQLPTAPPGQQGPAAVQKVVLLYANEQGKLVREAREVERCEDRLTCLRALLEELLGGPISGLEDIYPEWASINEVRIEGDLAVIDLSADFRDGLAAGDSAEILAVYGIVNTVCANLPEIKRVRISIDGNSQTRLRQLDLSQPLQPNLALEAQPEQPATERK